MPASPGELPGNGLGYTGARWLPDGKRIVVSASEPGHRARLYLSGPGRREPKPLTPEGVGSWVVSPDGSTIAASGPTPKVRLYPVDGTASRDVPGVTGRETPIGWITRRPAHHAAGADRARGDIYKVDVGTGRQAAWKNILPRDPAGIMVLGLVRRDAGRPLAGLHVAPRAEQPVRRGWTGLIGHGKKKRYLAV